MGLSGRLRRPLAAVAAALVVSMPATALAALTDQQRAERGIAYLVSAQRANGAIVAFSPVGSTADAVLAFVVARVARGPMRDALAYLRGQVRAGNVDTIGLRAKVVLAADAAGRDPRTFGGTNLLRAIRSTHRSSGRYGAASVFDDALAVLAIRSAGLVPGPKAGGWLRRAQCPDGGWAYDAPYDSSTDDAHCHSGASDVFVSDSNTTSYVVQALESLDATNWGADPFAWFDTVRDPTHGGWSYARSFGATDANSTALVIQAYVAAGRAIPSGGLIALRKLQYATCGAWAYTWNGSVRSDPDVGATIAAIPAVLRRALPIGPGPVSSAVPPPPPAC